MRVFAVIGAVALVQWLTCDLAAGRRRAAGRALHGRGPRVASQAASWPPRSSLEVGGRCSPRSAPRRRRRRCSSSSPRWSPPAACSASTCAPARLHRVAGGARGAARAGARPAGPLAAAAERARIARELHDIVAHNLSVMVALADGAGYTAEQRPGAADARRCGSVARTGREALGRDAPAARRAARRRDGAACARRRSPGIAAARALLEQVRAAGPAASPRGRSGAPPALGPGAQLTVYRIVQEALTNTLKHAGAGARRDACGCATAPTASSSR